MKKSVIKKYKLWSMRFIPIVCILLLIIGLSEIFYRRMINSEREQCWNDLSAARDETSTEISDKLNTNLKILELASDAIVMNADFSDVDAVCEYLLSVQSETVFDRVDIVFPTGTILVSSQEKVIKDKGEKTFEELLAKGTHLSQRVSDFLTGEPAVHAFSPVYSEKGEPIAIIGATMYCSTLSETIHSSYYGDDAQLFLVDRRDGNLVLDGLHESPGSIYDMSNYKLPEEYEGTDLISEIMSGNVGRISYVSERYKTTSYTIYAPIEGTDISMIMVVHEEVVLAELNDLKNTLLRVGIVETVLVLLVAIWIYFIMRHSMENEGRAQKAELELLHKKEIDLQSRYEAAANRREFLEVMAINLPGGYHRCTVDHSFRVSFASNSFTQITGYTTEQLEETFGGSYFGLVYSEDKDYFMSLAPQLENDGHIDCAYRILRKDGTVRWVQDSTQYVERDGDKYYQCSLMDISERVEELERAKLIAEASSHAKSTFLFNISHDIRTPMNAIKGFSHIIGENADNAELVRRTSKKIDQSASSLMMLINDVLDISRIERGKEEINLKPINLYAMGKNLYEMFSGDMRASGINFKADGETLRDYIYCDELKLTRIMMNMLSNAKKFTPAGGTVTFGGEKLSSDESSATYRFFVKDTGIGMSPEFLERAFEQFERERTSTESGVAGSGLGLAIIKMLVELMGGTVDVYSELGKGTEISATLTFAKVEPGDEQQAEVKQSAVDMSGKRVLLVEDNVFNREIAKYVLEGMQITVDEAENGAICLEKISNVPYDYYDVILMDIQMPVMDGYTATAEIRKLSDKQKAAIPIVAMTANAFDDDKRKCMEIGMNGHVGKPIDIADLTRVLSRVFS